MKRHLLLLAVGALIGAPAAAQSSADEIAKYRAMLADGNPADLWEAKGEALSVSTSTRDNSRVSRRRRMSVSPGRSRTSRRHSRYVSRITGNCG
jgi:hypothetical protein